MNPHAEAPKGALKLSLYITEPVHQEALNLSRDLAVSLDTLVHLAWELGKSSLYERLTGSDAKLGDAPAIQLPADLKQDGQKAVTPPTLAESATKVQVTQQLPARIIDEIQDLATHTDRSPSWIFQNAYLDARPRLFGMRD